MKTDPPQFTKKKSEFDCEVRGCHRHGRLIILGDCYSAVLCVRHERMYQHDCATSDEYLNLHEGKDEMSCRWGLLRGDNIYRREFSDQQRHVRSLLYKFNEWTLKWVNEKLDAPEYL